MKPIARLVSRVIGYRAQIHCWSVFIAETHGITAAVIFERVCCVWRFRQFNKRIKLRKRQPCSAVNVKINRFAVNDVFVNINLSAKTSFRGRRKSSPNAEILPDHVVWKFYAAKYYVRHLNLLVCSAAERGSAYQALLRLSAFRWFGRRC
ncbi:hypothetical protein MCHI_003615 [Candidatus Magnetoovum chiemensis]|nr:hypothetical protein MCHI_003615 [Candidatus Magnetoovum chiemensis]